MLIDFNNTEQAFPHRSVPDLKKAIRIFQLISQPFISKWGAWLSEKALEWGLPVKNQIKNQIFWLFCAGENLEETKATAATLQQYDVDVLLNLGFEGEANEAHFEKVLELNLNIIRESLHAKNIKRLAIKPSSLGSHRIFEKVQQGADLTDTERASYLRTLDRIDQLCEAAVEVKLHLYWDAEESWVQDTLDLIVDGMMAKYNQEEVYIFNTYQIYRHDKLDYLVKNYEIAKERGYKIGAKIVRGAYMEKERNRAAKTKSISPIHKNKAAVDADYNAAIQFCLLHIDDISLCAASHNEESCALLVELMSKHNIQPNHPHICISQLYGMGDHITFNLSANGYVGVKYVPFGPVKEVIPYLTRRANENSSLDGQMNQELVMLKKELKRRRKLRNNVQK